MVAMTWNQPPAAPSPSTQPEGAPQAPGAAPRGGRRVPLWVLLAAILATALLVGSAGLGVGGLVGALTSGSSGFGGSSSRSEQNFDEACALHERLEDDFPLGDSDFSLEEPLVFEVMAMGNSFSAGAAGDSSLEHITVAGNNLVASISRLEPRMANEPYEELGRFCEDR